jgi:hypothetical protein
MIRAKRRGIFATAGLILLAAPGLAAAQQGQGNSGQGAPMQQQQGVQHHYSNAQVNKFVKSFKDVSRIQKNFVHKMQGAGNDKSKIQQMQKDAEGKMVKAIRNDGLTVKQYNQMAQSMRTNQQLRQKVQSQLQK